MDPTPSTDQISFEVPQLFRIFHSGRIERLLGTQIVPPSTDPQSGVQSKDVLISPQAGLSARIFLPRITDPTRKLPLLVFIHGGAFCVETPFSPQYHNHVAALSAGANAVALSVDYRRAPEHPLPAAYDDAWEAAQWAVAHFDGDGPEAWLNDHADFGRVFVAGDSAGANIAHYVVRRAGVDGLGQVRIVGLVAFHPFFGDDGHNKLLEIIFPTNGGSGDPRLNPGSDPELASLGCEKVLVLVAEKDFLRERGWAYYEAVKKSGWGGKLEIVETEEEGHVFHLHNPTCDKAVALMKKVVSFLSEE
ncbi:Arylacetamide deacetylase [Trema orientale]|uniref:Arylacetamide deacetylase n=1 Tax=Trema orientale TaxID=63057 RepID=A0A2P5FZ81_TREOI|nr:Arylacetamide deacetylase [Trema orientale]